MDEVIKSILTDDQAMALAISEAEKGLGRVSPNPAVGCVILDQNNSLIGCGHHEIFGGPHAEINALKDLSNDILKDARVFVTLEPCSHFGKTPPCADKLALLPIKEVIYGLQDPNPQVQGQGLEKLRRAGIKVTHYNKNLEALERVCEHFMKNMRHQLPFITLKAATSIDGKLALRNGQSQWITGEEARLEGHRLRAYHDGLLVGVNTFLNDNPSLNIRHSDFKNKVNKVIVLDPTGRGISKIRDSKLYASHKPENIFWVLASEFNQGVSNENTDGKLNKNKMGNASSCDVNKKTLNDLSINHICISKLHKSKGASEELNLNELLAELWKLKVHSILVEGGGNTISTFINQKVADRISLFVAPMIVGDLSGVGWASNIHTIENLSQAVKLGTFSVSTLGSDLMISARFIQ